MPGSVTSLTSLLDKLGILDLALRERLKTIVRHHWQGDNRVGKGSVEGHFKIPRHSLALQLARELVKTPEYCLFFEGKRHDKSIRLIAEIYRTQWKYHRDTTVRHSPLLITAVSKNSKTQAKSASIPSASVDAPIAKVDNQSSPASPNDRAKHDAEPSDEQPTLSQLDKLLLDAEEMFGDKSTTTSLDQGWEVPSPTEGYWSRDASPELPEPNKEKQEPCISAGADHKSQMEDSSSADSLEESTEFVASSQISEISHKENIQYCSVTINQTLRCFTGVTLGRAVTVFSGFLDRVSQEEDMMPAADLIGRFHQIFEDFAEDASEAEKVYGHGFI